LTAVGLGLRGRTAVLAVKGALVGVLSVLAAVLVSASLDGLAPSPLGVSPLPPALLYVPFVVAFAGPMAAKAVKLRTPWLYAAPVAWIALASCVGLAGHHLAVTAVVYVLCHAGLAPLEERLREKYPADSH
jgi:hypothetical protein